MKRLNRWIPVNCPALKGRAYRAILGMGLSVLLTISLHSHADPRESLVQSSHQVVMVFNELSPVALPEEAWVPYSLCLVKRLNSLGTEDLSTEHLVSYIRKFDSSLYFPADVALLLETEVIDPCMRYNPIATLSKGGQCSH